MPKRASQRSFEVPLRVALGMGPVIAGGYNQELLVMLTRALWDAVRERERRRWMGFDFRLQPAHRAGAQLRRDPFPLRYGT